MAKRAKLSLSAGTKTTPTPTPTAEPAPRRPQASREGLKLVGGHVPRAMWEDLATLAIRLDRTHQDLIGEAVTDLLDKYRGNL